MTTSAFQRRTAREMQQFSVNCLATHQPQCSLQEESLVKVNLVSWLMENFLAQGQLFGVVSSILKINRVKNPIFHQYHWAWRVKNCCRLYGLWHSNEIFDWSGRFSPWNFHYTFPPLLLNPATGDKVPAKPRATSLQGVLQAEWLRAKVEYYFDCASSIRTMQICKHSLVAWSHN